MAPNSRGVRVSVPTVKPLPDSLRLPADSPHVWRTLSKVSRPSLLFLAAQWCEKENLETCGPYILKDGEEDDPEAPYAAAESLAEIEGLYTEELPSRKGSKREIVDRIVEGDWRHGISMKQLAMAETAHVLEHGNATRWTALKLVPHGEDDVDNSMGRHSLQHLPRLHTATFLRNLTREISPVAKAHLYMHQPPSFPGTVLRIYLHDTPYNSSASLRLDKTRKTDAPKSIIILFPASTPFIYVSLSASGSHLTDPESKSLQKFIVEAIPKALSRPAQRFELRPTGLSAKSLTALLAHRGPERSNAAGGGWSIFVTDSKGRNALDFRDDIGSKGDGDKENEFEVSVGGGKKRPFEHADPVSGMDANERKRLKSLAVSRFGEYGIPDDGKGLHSFSVRINDSFDRRGEEESAWKPDIKLTFQGTHVFAGLRALVEKGVLDGVRMPGWLTGEAGVSAGLVREGRIEGA